MRLTLALRTPERRAVAAWLVGGDSRARPARLRAAVSVGEYVLIRPEDDAAAEQVSDWAAALMDHADFAAHTCSVSVDASTPANREAILAALRQPAQLAVYFGHGDQGSWRTSDAPTVVIRNVQSAAGKAVVSIACKTSRRLGPAAVMRRKGVRSWLGFTVKVPVLPPHRAVDLFGDAMVAAVASLGRGASMREARDAIWGEFDALVESFDNGSRSRQFNAYNYYYSALAVRDHVVVHGSKVFRPLA